MTIHQLYRTRVRYALFLGLFAGIMLLALFGLAYDPRAGIYNILLASPPVVLGVCAVLAFKVARDCYRTDLGEIGPPELRTLVKEAREWEANGYRTPEEIAAGVPPRQHPPRSA